MNKFKIGSKVVLKEGFHSFRNLFDEHTIYKVSYCDFSQAVIIKEENIGQYPEQLELYSKISKERKFKIKNHIDERKIMRVIRE